MNIKKIALYLTTCSLISVKAFAGMDPVGWTIFPKTGLPATIQIGSSAVVHYTLINNLPRAAVLMTSITPVSSQVSVEDHCNGQNIGSGKICDIYITFKAEKPGSSTIQLIYGYHNNRIPLPKLTTIAQGQPVDEVIQGSISQLPATFSLLNPTQKPTFTVTYTNNGTLPATGYSINTGANATPSTVASVALLSPSTTPAAPASTCGTSISPITLQPGHSCSLTAQLTPLAIGSVTVNGLFTYSYSGGATKTAVPSAMSEVIATGGPCAATASLNYALPSSTYQYSDNLVGFKFTNNCVSGSATLGQVSVITTGVTSTTTMSTALDHCSHQTLVNNGDSCTVLASVVPNATTALMTVTASAVGTASNIATAAAVTAPTYTHTVHFINQCPFDVWYGVSNIDTPLIQKDPTTPATPDDYKLDAYVLGTVPTASQTYVPGRSIKSLTFSNGYNGVLYGRTVCAGDPLVCETANCETQVPPNGGKCVSGNSALNPYTRIESYLNPAAAVDGIVNLSVINGFNIPMEFKGLGPTTAPFTPPPGDPAAFLCTAAGAPIQPLSSPASSQLGACNWVVTPPSTDNMAPKFFNYVTDENAVEGETCSCTGGRVCGIAHKATNPEKGNLIMSCGTLLGVDSMTDICTNTYSTAYMSSANNPRTHFQCDKLLTSDNFPGIQTGYTSGTNLGDLFRCNYVSGTNLNSCYIDATSSTSYCCGARDWNISPILTAQSAQSFATNPDWISTSTLSPSPYGTISWLKTACPTSYVYPFDDKSSSFSCISSINMDYQLVFCPGGLTGKA